MEGGALNTRVSEEEKGRLKKYLFMVFGQCGASFHMHIAPSSSINRANLLKDNPFFSKENDELLFRFLTIYNLLPHAIKINLMRWCLVRESSIRGNLKAIEGKIRRDLKKFLPQYIEKTLVTKEIKRIFQLYDQFAQVLFSPLHPKS